MKRRALWLADAALLNVLRGTVSACDLAVFVPRALSNAGAEENTSVRVWDEDLGIPEADRERLDAADFLKRQEPQVTELVNKYFDIVFFDYVPERFHWLVRSFKGRLILCAAGLADGRTYTQAILDDLGIAVFLEMKETGDRFLFAQTYEGLKDDECDFFKQRTIDMPVNVGARADKERDGKECSKVAVYLPNIGADRDMLELCQSIRKTFSDISCVFLGEQPVKVNNNVTVLSDPGEPELTELMAGVCAIYYPLADKRALPPYLFEAVGVGLPVIFAEGGALGKLLDGSPGACVSVDEAYHKLKRLLRGEAGLKKGVAKAQNALLEKFSREECKKKWEDSFRRIDALSPRPRAKKAGRKIGVILPLPYLGGMLDYTLRLIKCIYAGAKEAGDDISLVFGYPDDPVYKEKDLFKDIRSMAVMRPYEWECKSGNWVRQVCSFLDVPSDVSGDQYTVNDRISFFEDCDYLIFTSNRVAGKVFTTRPYAVVVHDYIQRYVPDMFVEGYELAYMDFVRNAESVLTTTAPTFEDVIQYAGISRDKVFLTPLMFDLVSAPEGAGAKGMKKEYFLWSTNAAPHKNHKKALLGLADYYHKGGKLACVMTGVNTTQFDIRKKIKDPSPYIFETRKIIMDDPALANNIVVCGNMPKEHYLQTLQKAHFVFHPGYGDNGNGTAIDAACFGVPTVSSDYPAMRYIDETVGLNALFFDPFDEDSIRDALFEAEREERKRRAMVPSLEKLSKFTVESSYRELYKTVRYIIGG